MTTISVLTLAVLAPAQGLMPAKAQPLPLGYKLPDTTFDFVGTGPGCVPKACQYHDTLTLSNLHECGRTLAQMARAVFTGHAVVDVTIINGEGVTETHHTSEDFGLPLDSYANPGGYSAQLLTAFYRPGPVPQLEIHDKRLDYPSRLWQQPEEVHNLPLSPDPSCGETVQAKPGGPYQVQRGQTVTLDASHSTGNPASYRWTIAPEGSCEGGAAPRSGAEKTGATTTVVPLCGLTATLTVSNARSTDSASVPITVVARSWKTTVTFKADWAHPTSNRPPVVQDVGRGKRGVPLEFGENVTGPEYRADTNLYPYINHGSWLGDGYQVAQVHDPGGPFDGFYYIARSDLEIPTVGIFNQWIRPSARPLDGMNNFYHYNQRHKVNAAGFLRAVERHEGWGTPGKPASGHAMLMKQAVRNGHDPKQAIEGLFSPDRSGLVRTADTTLKGADRELEVRTCDAGGACMHESLVGNWNGPFYVRDSSTKSGWRKIRAQF